MRHAKNIKIDHAPIPKQLTQKYDDLMRLVFKCNTRTRPIQKRSHNAALIGRITGLARSLSVCLSRAGFFYSKTKKHRKLKLKQTFPTRKVIDVPRSKNGFIQLIRI